MIIALPSTEFPDCSMYSSIDVLAKSGPLVRCCIRSRGWTKYPVMSAPSPHHPPLVMMMGNGPGARFGLSRTPTSSRQSSRADKRRDQVLLAGLEESHHHSLFFLRGSSASLT
jgi:hypothetical protein